MYLNMYYVCSMNTNTSIIDAGRAYSDYANSFSVNIGTHVFAGNDAGATITLYTGTQGIHDFDRAMRQHGSIMDYGLFIPDNTKPKLKGFFDTLTLKNEN